MFKELTLSIFLHFTYGRTNLSGWESPDFCKTRFKNRNKVHNLTSKIIRIFRAFITAMEVFSKFETLKLISQERSEEKMSLCRPADSFTRGSWAFSTALGKLLGEAKMQRGQSWDLNQKLQTGRKESSHLCMHRMKRTADKLFFHKSVNTVISTNLKFRN